MRLIIEVDGGDEVDVSSVLWSLQDLIADEGESSGEGVVDGLDYTWRIETM